MDNDTVVCSWNYTLDRMIPADIKNLKEKYQHMFDMQLSRYEKLNKLIANYEKAYIETRTSAKLLAAIGQHRSELKERATQLRNLDHEICNRCIEGIMNLELKKKVIKKLA